MLESSGIIGNNQEHREIAEGGGRAAKAGTGGAKACPNAKKLTRTEGQGGGEACAAREGRGERDGGSEALSARGDGICAIFGELFRGLNSFS